MWQGRPPRTTKPQPTASPTTCKARAKGHRSHCEKAGGHAVECGRTVKVLLTYGPPGRCSSSVLTGRFSTTQPATHSTTHVSSSTHTNRSHNTHTHTIGSNSQWSTGRVSTVRLVGCGFNALLAQAKACKNGTNCLPA